MEQEWQISFNTSKCKCLHYGKKNPNNVYSFNTDEPIPDSTEEKDLGVQFDLHVNSIVNKANSILGLIKRNFKGMDGETLVKLY